MVCELQTSLHDTPFVLSVFLAIIIQSIGPIHTPVSEAGENVGAWVGRVGLNERPEGLLVLVDDNNGPIGIRVGLLIGEKVDFLVGDEVGLLVGPHVESTSIEI